MVTWHPDVRVTTQNEIVNDETEVTVKFLPLRFMLDQRAISFARALFEPDEEKIHGSQVDLPAGLHTIPPPLIRIFRMRPFKIKANYVPQKVNSQALRDGSLVELVNLTPIDSMILTLQEVVVRNEIGFSAVMSIVISRWVQDICATQITKFLTNARAFEPITQVSGAAVDMIVVPWDAFKNGQSVQKALRAGTNSFSQTLLSEAITITSRAAQFLAGNISKLVLTDNVMPRRPHGPPKGMLEATPHAVASISRGLQTANYKIIIIPYREYRRSGARGAVTSVLKGIPVAVAAPTSGAAEALSFALLGARNQLRPDIRKEEEANLLRNHLFDK
jgi:Autophagy-related protein C terminal domain